MDDGPVGIFDSGVGGLTSINAFSEVLPHESIIYFGDTARAPYGTKSPRTVRAFSVEIADFLVCQGAKMLVAACNTTSATALDAIRAKQPGMPVQGIIEPCAEKIAKECTADNSIGIIATPVTVASKAYETNIHRLAPQLNVHAHACPAFVPLIESGAYENGGMDETVRHTLDDFIRKNDIDTLVLGCTHYPIIRGVIEKLYPGITIIDPSYALAERVKAELEQNRLTASEWPGRRTFYASDLSQKFLAVIDLLGISGDYALEQHRL